MHAMFIFLPEVYSKIRNPTIDRLKTSQWSRTEAGPGPNRWPRPKGGTGAQAEVLAQAGIRAHACFDPARGGIIKKAKQILSNC